MEEVEDTYTFNNIALEAFNLERGTSLSTELEEVPLPTEPLSKSTVMELEKNIEKKKIKHKKNTKGTSISSLAPVRQRPLDNDYGNYFVINHYMKRLI